MKVQKGVTNSITHPTMDRSNFASLDAEEHLAPHLLEETTRIAYNMFIEASFKLGRITDCDPKVGKNLFRACEEFTELGLPIYFPFVRCEFV